MRRLHYNIQMLDQPVGLTGRSNSWTNSNEQLRRVNGHPTGWTNQTCQIHPTGWTNSYMVETSIQISFQPVESTVWPYKRSSNCRADSWADSWLFT